MKLEEADLLRKRLAQKFIEPLKRQHPPGTTAQPSWMKPTPLTAAFPAAVAPQKIERNPPLTNCVVTAEDIHREYSRLTKLAEQQLEETSKWLKLGAAMRVASLLSMPPNLPHNEFSNAEAKSKATIVVKDPIQNKPEKKSGPQPLKRRT